MTEQQANIIVNVSRTAAVRSGRSSWGKTIVDLEMSELGPYDRETYLALPTENGVPCLRVGGGLGAIEVASTAIPDIVAGIRRWADRRAAEIAQAEATIQEDVQAWWDTPDEELIGRNECGANRWSAEATRRIKATDRYERLSALAEQRQADAKRAQAESLAEARRANERRATARKSWELDILREHGTSEQLTRYRHGVLPRDEFRELVATTFLNPLGELAEYPDPEHSESCYEGGGEDHYGSKDLESLSAEEWRALRSLRDLASETLGGRHAVDAVTLYSEYDCCDSPVLRNAARLTWHPVEDVSAVVFIAHYSL